jgi:hypothetical protein
MGGTAEGHPLEGFLYGTVETRSGQEYTGVIRWGKEESFWDDHFNSVKENLPYRKYLPNGETRRQKTLGVFGKDIHVNWEGDYAARQFVVRFGDIVAIEPGGSERVNVHLKGGIIERVNGGSNDIGNEITIYDETLGETSVPWDRIEKVRFRSTPSDVDVPGRRLFGDVETEVGEFSGFIQWDSDECLSTDKLDGHSEDGKMSIPFGKIRSIAREGAHSLVRLSDGRELTLSGSNDVDKSIRGILVEDPRYGRVKIGWRAFVEARFRESRDTGRPYSDYRPSEPIHGTVHSTSGKVHSGRIVIDLDEDHTWEFLNGSRADIDYLIPIGSVLSIEPRGRGSLVVLRGGSELNLNEGKDVSDESDGVLIWTRETLKTYLPWDDVERIDLDEPPQRTPRPTWRPIPSWTPCSCSWTGRK